MAELVIAAAGSALGAYAIPGTILGLSGASIGYFAGSLLASALIKPPGQQGPRLGDLRVQGTEYGQPFPWVAGAPRLAGQIVWASQRREIANTQKVGKGGGQKVTTFTYEVDLLIVLTENVTSGISRSWLNGELVVNVDTVKEGLWNGFTIYTGAEDQMPDPTYEAAVGDAPAYRGRTSIMIRGLQLGNSGQIGNLTWEVGSYFGTTSNYVFIGNFEGTYVDGSEFAIAPTVVQALPTFGYSSAALGKFGSGLGYTGNPNAGVVAYLLYSNTAYQLGADPFTMGFWIKMDSYPLGSGDFIFWLRNATLTQNCGFQGTTTGIRFFSDFTSPVNVSLTLGVWTYVAASRNLAGTIKVYKNGVLIGTTLASAAGSNATQLMVHGNDTANNHVACTLDAAFIIKGEDLYPAAFDPPTGPPSAGATTSLLPDVVEALMLRAGYEADDFSVAGLSPSVVRGMAQGQVSNTRGPLETLQTAFFFEPSKSDKIYFKQRSSTALVSIPFADLGAAADAVNDEDPLALIVGNELEVPAQVSLSYANMLGDYNAATEHSDRLLTGQETNQVVQLGLGMLPSEAKGVADALLFDQIAGLTRTTLRLPLKYAYLEPGDVFTVTNQDGRVYRLRSQVKRDNLTIIEHECTLDDATALTSSQITSEDYALSETVRSIAPTIWEAMDIPLLRDADNQAGFYVAVAPDRALPADEWPGAVFVRSWSADAFEQLFTSGDSCVMGSCTTILGGFDGGSGRFDEGHTLTVRVTGELANTTRADMLNDLSLNAALVGSEIIRFRLAELLGTVNGENEYRLSGFVRGQRGTEQHIGTHTASERFVLLNASLRRVLDQNSEIGVLSDVKAVTLNKLLSAVTAEAFTDTAVALKPFSVAGLRALASGSDLVLTWNRRTRLSYRYGGTVGASVPLGEATEVYRIDVYDGVTFKNTYTATDGSYTYTAANLAADGFTTGEVVTFVVRQVSEIVGPGFPATVERAAP